MKKSIKGFVGVVAVGISLISSGSAFGLQLETSPSGGWSESKGYYENAYQTRGMQIAATSSPQTHYGERQTRYISAGGYQETQAYGYTIWTGKYHYTNARMEKSNGTVLVSSGRKYGNDRTDAYSGWYGNASNPFENLEARTYWGS